MTTVAQHQLALDFEHRPALGRDDFVVSKANRDAVAWIDRWPGWRSTGLVLIGPPGSGKTHLARVWTSRSGAEDIDFRSLSATPAGPALAQQRAVLIEGLDIAASLEAETELLHIINILGERGGTLLLTAQTAPAQMSFALPDLASRLRAMPVVALEQPDDALLGAVLHKLFADRQLVINREVIRYLVRRGERSFAAARLLVETLDRAALERKRDITVSLARDILGET